MFPFLRYIKENQLQKSIWSGPTFSVISLKVVKNVCLMHILHFEMSISASKCATIISNINLLADLKNLPIVSSCVTHILPFCGYFKGQEKFVLTLLVGIW